MSSTEGPVSTVRPGALSSARLLALVITHEEAESEIEDLRQRSKAGRQRLQAAKQMPGAVPFIEDHHRIQRENHELAASCEQELCRIEDRMERLVGHSQGAMRALLIEGMPADTPVGIGAEEYVLLEYRGSTLKLRRGSREELEAAFERSSPHRGSESNPPEREAYTGAALVCFWGGLGGAAILGNMWQATASVQAFVGFWAAVVVFSVGSTTFTRLAEREESSGQIEIETTPDFRS